MKKIMIVLAATTVLTVATPAAAQYAGANIELRVEQLQTQLQMGVRNGDITRSEAMPLREQLRQLTRLERQYRVGGISGRERADLQHRINSVRQGIRMAARNGDDRYARDDDRYDRDDRDSDGRYDRDNDGWDDRDGNRDGRWDEDDRYDRGQVDRNDGRGIVGQILDRVTGGGGLRVGQRASADLGAVPYEYRGQYRDGNGAYYRSDGRQIYKIDARTHVVARVFAMNR